MNSFGRLFRLHIFGESHGPALGMLLDGCPPGLELKPGDFAADLNRRRGGAEGTTTRCEADSIAIQSGVFAGRTTGAPILLHVANADTRSEDYDQLRYRPRPGHADWTAWKKYGDCHDHRGGGHFSGRLTLGLVVAGVVARKLLPGVDIVAAIEEIGGRRDYQEELAAALAERDSLGGIISCRVTGLTAGCGEPFFDSLESLLAHLLFAIPGIKGVEFGSGFAAAGMRGSVHNDPLLDRRGTTAGNNAGGISGGISNGNPLTLRVAVKPTSSIARPQDTVDLRSGEPCKLQVEGRHDCCFALRLPVVVEAAVAVVLADCVLLRQAGAPVCLLENNHRE